MNSLTIFTDGGARGNPGLAAIGVVIKNEGGSNLASLFRTIGQTTNNVAEYKAVIAALMWLKSNRVIEQLRNTKINFFLDSKLVVNQLNGLFKVKDSELRELLLEARMLEQEIGGEIHYQLIPRERNWEADALVNKALDENS